MTVAAVDVGSTIQRAALEVHRGERGMDLAFRVSFLVVDGFDRARDRASKKAVDITIVG